MSAKNATKSGAASSSASSASSSSSSSSSSTTSTTSNNNNNNNNNNSNKSSPPSSFPPIEPPDVDVNYVAEAKAVASSIRNASPTSKRTDFFFHRDRPHFQEIEAEEQAHLTAERQERKQEAIAKLPTFWSELLSNPVNRGTLKVFWFFTISMIIFPLGSFVLCLYLLTLPILFSTPIDDDSAFNYAGIAAVVAVNVVLAAFAIYAWNEPEEEESEEEKKESALRHELILDREHRRLTGKERAGAAERKKETGITVVDTSRSIFSMFSQWGDGAAEKLDVEEVEEMASKLENEERERRKREKRERRERRERRKAKNDGEDEGIDEDERHATEGQGEDVTDGQPPDDETFLERDKPRARNVQGKKNKSGNRD